MVEYVVIDCDTGCHQLRYAAFHEFFCQFRILKLLAYRHTLAGSYELGQVGVERVVGKTGKLHVLRHAVGAPRKCYSENFRGSDSVIGKGFIEVTYTEQQYRVGMLLFHLDILLHEGSFSDFLCHGSLILELKH